MAGAFKTIATKNITRHTAHKSYDLSIVSGSGSFDGLQAYTYYGVKNTTEYTSANNTLTTNNYARRDIWDSINTYFYKNFGSYQGQVVGTPTGSLMEIKDPISDINVISLPHLMVGDGIKPNSVILEYATIKLKDDGLGNLIMPSLSDAKVGNVFYTHGLVVLHSSSYVLEHCDIQFKNTHVIEEHEYMCNATKQEFNATTNQSVLSDIANGTVAGFVTSSAFNPYVTTVGLYDDNSNLLAIGKLGQAIKKSEKFDTSYVVRFDT